MIIVTLSNDDVFRANEYALKMQEMEKEYRSRGCYKSDFEERRFNSHFIGKCAEIAFWHYFKPMPPTIDDLCKVKNSGDGGFDCWTKNYVGKL